jgi:hypothetical protein
MRPEVERALRFSPKIHKKLREQLSKVQRAVATGTEEEIAFAARVFVEVEAEADDEVQRKRPKPREHLIKFLVSDEDYAHLAETALEHQLEPDEVARRLFNCGRRFEQQFCGHIRRGGTADTLFSKGPGGQNPLPAIILPDFSRREP